MANGLLDLTGALVLVGAVLAGALIILWLSIRSFPASAYGQARAPEREGQEAPEDLRREFSTMAAIEREMDPELAEAMETNRSL